MTARDNKRGFAARPGNAETWVKMPDRAKMGHTSAEGFTARLTIDVTPGLRGRIKVAAFQRGITVAEMLRDLLTREYPDDSGGVP